MKIKEVIVVEGKYDKIKLSQIFDTLIITTEGFGIYKNKQKMALLKRLAKENGVIVLTDSDSAGFRIRNYIKQCFGDIPIKQAYIPDVSGKEKRKAKPSAEGFLGVEGIEDKIIIDAVLKAGVNIKPEAEKITKADLYSLGLVGAPQSSARRSELAQKLNLPIKISSNALLDVLNTLYTMEEIKKHIDNLSII